MPRGCPLDASLLLACSFVACAPVVFGKRLFDVGERQGVGSSCFASAQDTCLFYIFEVVSAPFCMKESFVAIHCLVIPSPFSLEVSRVLSTSVHMRRSGL